MYNSQSKYKGIKIVLYDFNEAIEEMISMEIAYRKSGVRFETELVIGKKAFEIHFKLWVSQESN